MTVARLVLAVALAASVCFARPAAAAEVLRATSMLPQGLAYTDSFLDFVAKVNEQGADAVEIRFVGGPEAIPTSEQANALRSGVIDMIYGPSSYYPGEVPEVDALLGTDKSAQGLRDNGGLELLNRIHQSRLNAYLLAHPDAGHGFHIYLSRRPRIGDDGLPDLSGLRIRGAQLYREFFLDLGASYVAIPVPEVYTALERGTVVGVGWPSVGVMDFSWDNFLSWRIDPAYFQTDLVILVNLDRWRGLGDDARAFLQAAAIAHERDSAAALRALAAAEDAEMRRRGIEVITLDEAAARRYRAAAMETAWARLERRDATHYDALRALFWRGDG